MGDLRRLARKDADRTVQRLLAITNVMDGMSRAEAVQATGIRRQAVKVNSRWRDLMTVKQVKLVARPPQSNNQGRRVKSTAIASQT